MNDRYDADELVRKYHNDPLFHALVHRLGCFSFTNDDGVVCNGPSLADARRVQGFLDALPDGFAKVNGQTVWLTETPNSYRNTMVQFETPWLDRPTHSPQDAGRP